MSAVAWSGLSRGRPPLVALPVAAGGAIVLLARPWLLTQGMGVSGLALVYAALAAASIAASVRPPRLDLLGRAAEVPARPILHPGVALAIGAGAVGVARLTAGPVAPLAAGGTAVLLNLLAAITEEAFFRRFLYGALLPFGAPLAVLLSGVAFALVHVPLYGGAVFWVDLGAGLLLGWQRWVTGSWQTPAATHAVANFLAVLR
jgi:membrane protease YdiL (CAAX protease family)